MVLVDYRFRYQSATEALAVLDNLTIKEQGEKKGTILARNLEYPEGVVELNSIFYASSSPVEEQCYQNILKPGALLRIKAPRQMGKTSLLLRILDYGSKQGYQTAQISFLLLNKQAVENLDQFLYWFCETVTRKLKLANNLPDYWSGKSHWSSKDKCSYYFEDHIFSAINHPVVLGLDMVDMLFPYPEIATEFFALLRAWHEQAKGDELTWKKLRMVIAHSQEEYPNLDINRSPFNVGLPIELPLLNQLQVKELVNSHGLTWTDPQIEQLVNFTGGHPYLTRLALYHIAQNWLTLERLLEIGTTQESPYYNHLRDKDLQLEANNSLKAAFLKIVKSPQPLDSNQINHTDAFKLRSMGLIRFEGNQVMPLGEIYRQYFIPNRTKHQNNTQNQPSTEKKNNWLLIGGIIGAIALLIIVLFIFLGSQRDDNQPQPSTNSNLPR
jgi:hypothetical protein